MMLKDKTILLGVTGGIAAYKSAMLASRLVKTGACVHVIMTQNATNFINPITFETLTRNKCIVDTFDRNFEFKVEHVALAQKADVIMVAPATANVIAKLAHGLADDMLTTTILASKAPKIIAPAMNTGMYENPITQDNLERLRKFDFEIAEPAVGYLACGDTGAGKMLEPEILLQYILQEIAFEKDLTRTKVLVTAGATQEALDPVRYLTNHSTGKMGYAIAQAAARRGAEVTLVSGKTALQKPLFLRTVEVVSAEEMFQAVTKLAPEQDIIIKAAAVADYTPATIAEEKVKKSDDELSIPLKRTKDILQFLGEHRTEGQFLCGFSMETEHMVENSRKKLEKKRLDLIAANNLKVEGAGFAGDTNVLTLISKDAMIELKKMTKEAAAHALLDTIQIMRGCK